MESTGFRTATKKSKREKYYQNRCINYNGTSNTHWLEEIICIAAFGLDQQIKQIYE